MINQSKIEPGSRTERERRRLREFEGREGTRESEEAKGIKGELDGMGK
jgi:hypothetical protein